jgi:putative acetyltransferase
MSEISIRAECAKDRIDIDRIHREAFGRADEALLIERLRRDRAVLESLVAEIHGVVAGHILFTRMWIETASGDVPAVALAPLAVAPEWRRLGIGGLLTGSGLASLANRGERIAIVLGNPAWYSRFGFSTGLAAALESPFRRESYLAIELVAGALSGVRGKVRYAAAFGL